MCSLILSTLSTLLLFVTVHTYPNYRYATPVKPHQQYSVPEVIDVANRQEEIYDVPATSHIEQIIVIPPSSDVATTNFEEASIDQPHTQYGIPHPKKIEEYGDVLPNYDFVYGVYDGRTRDIKGHRETRVGNNVKGSYAFIEADGRKRTVLYTADENGFNADVHHEENPNIPYPTQLVRFTLQESNRPAKSYGVPN